MGNNDMGKDNLKMNPLRHLISRKSLLSFLILLSLLIAGFVIRYFFTGTNIYSTAIGMSSDGMMAIGMTLVLITGGIDLSIGSMLAFSVVFAGSLFTRGGISIWGASLISVAVTSCFGFVSGLLVGKLKVNPFIVTLSMTGIVGGLANVVTMGRAISLSNMPFGYHYLGSGDVLGIPIFTLIMLGATLLIDLMVRKSSPMRSLIYTGSNENAAILSGINVSNVKVWVYTANAAIVGLAGILSLARLGVASPSLGISAEMRVISGCVIGGASLNGGEGSVLGSVLGVMLLSIINKGLVLTSVPQYWQNLIAGLVLMMAILIDVLTHNRQKQ